MKLPACVVKPMSPGKWMLPTWFLRLISVGQGVPGFLGTPWQRPMRQKKRNKPQFVRQPLLRQPYMRIEWICLAKKKKNNN
jgi:hypothetical protein